MLESRYDTVQLLARQSIQRFARTFERSVPRQFLPSSRFNESNETSEREDRRCSVLGCLQRRTFVTFSRANGNEDGKSVPGAKTVKGRKRRRIEYRFSSSETLRTTKKCASAVPREAGFVPTNSIATPSLPVFRSRVPTETRFLRPSLERSFRPVARKGREKETKKERKLERR